jgi:hypothetical protein
MSRYRRARIEGGTFFFTVTLADRSSDLLVRHIDRLRSGSREVINGDDLTKLRIRGSGAFFLSVAATRRKGVGATGRK